MQEPFINKQRLLYRMAIGIVLGIGVFTIFLFVGDLQTIGVGLFSLPGHVYIVSVLIMCVVYIIRFIKWHLLTAFQQIPMTLKANGKVFMVGLSMAVTPGKAGELIKTYLIRKETGKRPSVTSAAVFFDRLADLTAVILLTLAGLSYFPDGMVLTITILCLMILGLMVLRSKTVGPFLVRLVTVPRKLRRYRSPLLRILLSIKRLLSWNVFVISTILSLIYWFTECALFFYINGQLGIEITLLQTVLVFTLSALVGAFSFWPGGLGAIEGSLFGLLVFFGANTGDALISTLLIRVLTLWLGCFAGWFVFVLGGILHKMGH